MQWPPPPLRQGRGGVEGGGRGSRRGSGRGSGSRGDRQRRRPTLHSPHPCRSAPPPPLRAPSSSFHSGRRRGEGGGWGGRGVGGGQEQANAPGRQLPRANASRATPPPCPPVPVTHRHSQQRSVTVAPVWFVIGGFLRARRAHKKEEKTKEARSAGGGARRALWSARPFRQPHRAAPPREAAGCASSPTGALEKKTRTQKDSHSH